MSHLSLETIARLVDDAPNTEEAAHLASCTVCRTELDAMTEDVHALSMLPDMAAAPDRWPALEQRLVAEGLIRSQRPFAGSRRLMQIAAALMLFVGGSLAGRLTAEPEIRTVTQRIPSEPLLIESRPDEQATLAADVPAAEPSSPGGEAVGPAPRSFVSLAAAVSQAGTVEEAATVLRDAEELYLGALTRYAELASQSPAGDPVARLAALQSIVMTTQAALHEMPTDPVINGYHLTALAQRDATLRQVAATSDRWY